jgi:hypothetical protein
VSGWGWGGAGWGGSEAGRALAGGAAMQCLHEEGILHEWALGRAPGGAGGKRTAARPCGRPPRLRPGLPALACALPRPWKAPARAARRPRTHPPTPPPRPPPTLRPADGDLKPSNVLLKSQPGGGAAAGAGAHPLEDYGAGGMSAKVRAPLWPGRGAAGLPLFPHRPPLDSGLWRRR